MRTYITLLLLLASGMAGYGQSQAGFTASPSASTNTPNTAVHRGDYDPLLDLPPLPHNTVTLMGGVVVSMDEVMNHMTFQPFGTKQKLHVHFDTRTKFYEDGKPITEREVKQGQRVYLDSTLNGDKVFAKTIWIRTTMESGIARGQIVDFDAQHRVLTLRDELSNQPLRLRLTPQTAVRKGNQTASDNDLVENALVSVEFGERKDLRGITVLATPGTSFAFAGRVTYVDLSQKLIAIDNRSDNRRYDVYMEAIAPNVLRQVHEGGNVSVSAVFDGNRYSARSIDVPRASSQQP